MRSHRVGAVVISAAVSRGWLFAVTTTFAARTGGYLRAGAEAKSIWSIPAPDSFHCPITHEIFKDPVRTHDDHVFERHAITRWLRDNPTNPTNPLTNLRLASDSLRPDRVLKSSIDEFLRLRAQLQERLRDNVERLRVAADGPEEPLRTTVRDFAAELEILAGERTDSLREGAGAGSVASASPVPRDGRAHEALASISPSAMTSQPSYHRAIPFEISSVRVIATLPATLAVLSLAWSDDGTQLAIGTRIGTVEPSRGSLWIVDAATGLLVRIMKHGGAVSYVAWSNGRIAIMSDDGMLRIVNATNGSVLQERREVQSGRTVHAVAWAHGRFAMGTDRGKLRIAAADSSDVEREVNVGGEVSAIAWSQDATHVAIATWNQDATRIHNRVKVLIVNTVSGEMVRHHWPHREMVLSITWSPNDERMAIGSYNGMLRLVDVATGGLVWTVRHEGPLSSVEWSSIGTHIATGDDSSVRIVDAATGVVVQLVPHDCVVSTIAWSKCGTRLAAACAAGRLRIVE